MKMKINFSHCHKLVLELSQTSEGSFNSFHKEFHFLHYKSYNNFHFPLKLI